MATKRKAKAALSADHYTCRLAWSVKDNEFIATVVEEVLQDTLAEGEEIPAPWDERTFCGEFNLRLGPDLHKKVALEAAERHESMNTYVIKQLGLIDA
ncbi:MAG: toxin-antitoxin system HicB family antitoxin [Actinomycetota bacterium]|nr:toxin-antitoxin system HicB family antitoxin [Actinomycetota bacterium]